MGVGAGTELHAGQYGKERDRYRDPGEIRCRTSCGNEPAAAEQETKSPSDQILADSGERLGVCVDEEGRDAEHREERKCAPPGQEHRFTCVMIHGG